MKSIRRRITAWLLAGLAVLWVAGGTAIYLASRAAMLATMDTELHGLSRPVRAMSRSGGGGGPGRRQWQPGDGPSPAEMIPEGTYYQVWSEDGEVLLRSANLGERNLTLLEVTAEEAAFRTIDLAPGKRVRMMATRFASGRGGGRRAGHGPPGGGGPGGGGPGRGGPMGSPVVVAVARDLADLESQSRKLLWGLGAIGLAVAAGTCLVLALALRDGLRPLRKLGEAVGAVDANSLDARFGGGPMPRELQPIVARLDELMERMEAGFQRERRFSADLAHELRTPISEIRVMADLALKWPEERTEEQMRDLRGVAKRMQRMVDTLLQLARLEGGQGAVRREPVDLAKMIGEVWQPLTSLARERNLHVRLDWPPGATMPGDPELWRHLLGNLLANAAEYAPAGGRVVVERGPHSIRVANSAEGLDDRQVARLFERFWRADASHTGDTHCGLGLSLAKACAEAMDLQITATLKDDPQGGPLLVIEIAEPPFK